MEGWIAVTHHGWYEHLARRPFWDEVNFWRPSARHAFRGTPGSPFFFKLKTPHNAIGGFGLVARFSRLPDWLAWESFREANGAVSFAEMEQRLNEIRTKNKFRDAGPVPQIGCILLSTAVFFPPELWIPQPADWPVRNLTNMRYDLTQGEGLRIWRECEQRLIAMRGDIGRAPATQANELSVAEDVLGRFGKPQLVAPRLGQGAFRIGVTDAYGRACTVTGEHSLPALEAAHIKPYRQDGPHAIANGLLLRADLHRLFDQGYLTVTPQHRLEISRHLRIDYANGRSYYPHHGREIVLPDDPACRPSPEFLHWHNENVYRA
ncbi:MAG: HNH endonuclease [Acidobacteria bacterium]|nr:HNH endonuclease [Acidobacteriota bacterium]MYD71814.1 HNH endonuclease [Acidobacteriota bacterium]MYJ03409.1 HNH endonuclease [Acidobacteriota bacterium]